MFKRFAALFTAVVCLLFVAGCNLIGIALAAGAAYGMSKIWTH